MKTIVCPQCAHEFPHNTMQERFWNSVRKTNDCWEWVGYVSPSGYGICGHTKTKSRVETFAHRYSWMLAYGEIPQSMFVCHKCDNRKCVRPDHLFLGTAEENAYDMVSKGRNAYGERASSAKLTDERVRAIRQEYLSGKVGCLSLAKKYGVSKRTIQNIVHGDTWKHLLEV